MINKSLCLRILMICLFYICIGQIRAVAAIEPYQHMLQGKIKKGDTLIVKDEKFRNSAYDWSLIRNKTVDNMIVFGFYTDVTPLPRKNFKCKIDLKIEYWSQPDQIDPVTEDHVELEISYDTAAGAVYQAEKAYHFRNGHRVKVTVNDITSAELGEELPDVFRLLNMVTIDRQYLADPANTQQNKPYIIPSAPPSSGNGMMLMQINPPEEANGEVTIGWPADPVADEYDLDWTFIDAESENGALLATYQSTPPNTVLENMFRNNFTRVTVEGHQYPVSLVHQSKYLLVRLRTVSYETGGFRNERAWEYLVHELTNTWHEPGKNWQYNATYAEEGKKKEVVSYADGTLRTRQSVTVSNPGASVHLNTQKYAVVQESIYDEFGRPVVSVLPAPIKASELKYYPLMNLNSGGTPYNFFNMYGAVGDCIGKPEQMFSSSDVNQTSRGAATYYSADNPFRNDAFTNNKYIPDAQRYPFAVTRYTPDNTGRVMVQGGVGETFQPGPDGKATRYFYGKPEQWELDRLFGNDAGFAEHYLKNMTIDPNGQISISYINASGKTVATALTGPTPDNVKPLASQPVVSTKTSVLLRPSQFRFDHARLTLSATANYMVSLEGPFQVNYNIDQFISRYTSANVDICSNCYYTLKITVSDDCGNRQEIAAPSFVGSKLSNCNVNLPSAGNFTYTPQALGTHYIRFELGLSEEVIGAYTDDFISRNTDLKTEFQFLLEQLNAMNFKDCISDCSTCLGTLGEKTVFINRVRAQLAHNSMNVSGSNGTAIDNWSGGLYDVLLAHCQSIRQQCSLSPCEENRRLMLKDVSPGGQYALFTQAGAAMEASINVIYNKWRTVFPVYPSSDARYKQEQFELEDGTITSPHDINFQLKTLLDYWNPAWAERFLQYHPEQCALAFCETNSQYLAWDEKVKTEILTAAQIPQLQSGLQYSQQSDWLVNADPFFKSGGAGYSQAATFRNELMNYSSTVITQTHTVKGLTGFVDYVLYCADEFGNINTSTAEDKWANCTPAANCRVPDREWRLYREKYFALKEKYYRDMRNATCSTACKPGKPVTVVTSSCPPASMFSITSGGPLSNDPSLQYVTIKYLGAAAPNAVTLKLGFPQGYGELNNEVVTTLNSVNSRYWPSTLNVNDVRILSVECEPVAGTPEQCNGIAGTLSLTATGKRTGEYSFEETVNGVIQKYFLVKGYSDEQPDVAPYCPGGAAVFRNCYKVFMHGSTTPISYYNVWVISCGAGTEQNMAPELSAQSMSIQSIPCSFGAQDFEATRVATPPQYHRFSIEYIGGVPIPPDITIVVDAEVEIVDWGTFQERFEFNSTNYTTPLLGNLWTTPTGEHFVSSISLKVVYCVERETGTCDPLYATKTPRFNDVIPGPMEIADLPQLHAEGQANFQQHLNSSCESNVDTWLQQMEECLAAYPDYQTKKAALRAGLIAVCKRGGDIDHIDGASTTPPGTTTSVGNYTSFGDVIKQVMGISSFSMTCNPWLIDGPYPYKVKRQATNTVVNKTSPEICAALNKLVTDHTSSGTGGTLFNYLQSKFGDGMNITSAELDMLLKGCNNCKYLLEKDMKLPVFLDPGTTGCVTAQQYNTAKAAFATALGGSPDPQHANYQRAFATYMNHQWGFTMGYDQYEAYEASLTANPNATLCNKPAFGETPADDPLSCIMTLVNDAVHTARYQYAAYIDKERKLFRDRYIKTCSSTRAQATLQAPQQIYHYTLYYYDQAGQLIRTVPPQGVVPLTDAEVEKVAYAREHTSTADCEYAGPASASTTAQVADGMNSLLSGTDGAMEFWLKAPISGPVQVLFTSAGTRRYLYNACIGGNYMNVDIYELVPAVNGTAVDIVHSYHTAVDITPVQPLREFVHVVIQGNDLTAHNLQIFVNGVACANAPNAPVSICGWQIGFNGQTLQYPENYTAVQHIRLYDGPLPQNDIAKLASNTCMANVGLGGNVARTGWYRFNVQAGGTGSGLEASPVYPIHTMATSYAYNTLGQVVQQKTPDAGISKFWYDYLGRLILSQNAEQLAPAETGAASNRFSYTTYDQLGRITEVGEALNLAAIPQKPFLQQAEYNTVMANTTRQQITRTYYDVRPPWITQTLDNLRKRVVATVYEETAGTPQQSTYYSYDQLGNVKSLWQSIAGLPTKQIEYNYDLASGKVNAVRYQAGGMEKFMYRYKYDAENRLVEVSNGYGTTGEDNWEIEYGKRQAVYQYYPHGPLSRIELGELNIQGIDYAYTLQGWLKGINGQFLDPSKDMGGDGSTRPTFAKDVMAYSLNYFQGDYQQVGTGVNTFALQFDPNGNFDGKPLYNGNISAITTALSQFRSGAPVGYSYTYDQLNRLVQMRQQDLATDATTWLPRASGNIPYKEDITYDGNGNILTYKRNGSRTDVDDVMDNLTYTYANTGGNPTNRLLSVQDASTNAGYSTDFKGTNGYTYDKIGNLMSETPNGASSIKWTVYGKIRSIVPTGGGSLSYRYDAGGNRVYKLYNKPGGGTVETWYVRDAQGNPLATYTKENGTTEWSEQHLYGSSRLGLWKPELNVTASVEEAETKWLAEGGKRYELTNHLGNVMAVLSDKRLGGPVYTVEVLGMQDYYPFGMLMVGRSLGAGGYRYGFNGKENDNEVKGEGNQQDYGMRVYDPRLGRFLSTDPLTKSYPWYTSFQFAGNNPIKFIDIDGAEGGLFGPGPDQWFYEGLHRTAEAAGENPVEYIKSVEGQRLKASATGMYYGAMVMTGRGAPPIGIPWIMTDLTGAPVLPAPQAMSGNVVSRVVAETESTLVESRGVNSLSDVPTVSPGKINSTTTSSRAASATNAQAVAVNNGNTTAAKSNISSSSIVPRIKRNTGYENWGGEFLDDAIRTFDQPFQVRGGIALQSSVNQVMGSSYKAVGEVTAQIKNTELLKSLNATSSGDWIKVYEAGIQNGNKIETHYFRNNTTGQVFDVKTKYNYWHQKQFKSLE